MYVCMYVCMYNKAATKIPKLYLIKRLQNIDKQATEENATTKRL